MHRSYGLQGSLKRRYKHPSPTSINGYHTAKKLLSQSPAKRPTFAFADESGYTHSPLPTGSHTTSHTPKQGPSGRGRYHYPRSVPHVHKHPRAGYQNGKLCRFWVLAGCTPEGRRKPAGQRCAYACRCPAGVAAPLGCVIFSVSVEIAACMPCAQGLSVCARRGVVSLPSAHFTCC